MEGVISSASDPCPDTWERHFVVVVVVVVVMVAVGFPMVMHDAEEMVGRWSLAMKRLRLLWLLLLIWMWQRVSERQSGKRSRRIRRIQHWKQIDRPWVAWFWNPMALYSPLFLLHLFFVLGLVDRGRKSEHLQSWMVESF